MNELNKYNLTSALHEADKLEQLLIDSGGEITDEIEQALVVSERTLAQSVDQEIQKIERIDYIAQLYKKKADTFAMIAKTMKLYIERREQQVKDYMLTYGLESLKGSEYEYFLAKPTKSTDAFDTLLIPDEFVKVTRTPRLKEIKAAIDAGQTVPGARLIDNRSLRTRINRGK